MKRILPVASSGFTLIEMLVSVFVFATVTTAVVGLAVLGTRAGMVNEQRTVALAIANERAENIRLLPYGNVGYTDVAVANDAGCATPVTPAGELTQCEPHGVLPRTGTVTRNGGQVYTVDTQVKLIDDSTNGLLGTVLTSNNADYKSVLISVHSAATVSNQQGTGNAAATTQQAVVTVIRPGVTIDWPSVTILPSPTEWPPTPTWWPTRSPWPPSPTDWPPTPTFWPTDSPWPPSPTIVPTDWPPTPTIWPTNSPWPPSPTIIPTPSFWPTNSPWPPSPWPPTPTIIPTPSFWPSHSPWPPSPWPPTPTIVPTPTVWPTNSPWPPSPWPTTLPTPTFWPTNSPWPPSPTIVPPTPTVWPNHSPWPPSPTVVPPSVWPTNSPWPPSPIIPTPSIWPTGSPWPPSPTGSPPLPSQFMPTPTVWPTGSPWPPSLPIPTPSFLPSGEPWPPSQLMPTPSGNPNPTGMPSSLPSNIPYPSNSPLPWPPNSPAPWPTGSPYPPNGPCVNICPLPVSWCFGGNLISISWAAGCPICGLIYSNTPNDLCGKPPKPGHVWCDTDEDGQTNCGPKYARDPINIPKGGSCPAGTRITCCYYFDTTTASYNPGDTCTAADGTTSTVQENTNAATGCKYYSCPSSCFQLNRAGCTGNSPAGTSCQGVNENGQSATGQCTVMTVDGTKCKYGVCTVPHTTTTGYTTNTSNPSTGSGHCSTTCTTTGTYDTCTTYC